MTRNYRTLFPELNLRFLITVLASPVIIFLIVHYGVSGLFETHTDNHFSTLFMITIYCSAISVYFAFDGISQNKPNRIPLIRSLPTPRKTVRSAVIELVIINVILVCINCTTSVLFPALFKSVIPESPKMIPVMIFCSLIFFGVYLSICTLTNSFVFLLITFVFSVFLEIPLTIAQDGEYYIPMLIATAILAAISVTGGTVVSMTNIGRRVLHD